MGMFDHVRCLAPLPDGFVGGETAFQTKDFDCAMEQYTITAAGHLVAHRVEWEVCPDEERPNFGTPQWDTPLGQYAGLLRPAHEFDEALAHTGPVAFYATNVCMSGPDGVATHDDTPPVSREYVAEFLDGRLVRIEGGAVQTCLLVPHRTRQHLWRRWQAEWATP